MAAQKPIIKEEEIKPLQEITLDMLMKEEQKREEQLKEQNKPKEEEKKIEEKKQNNNEINAYIPQIKQTEKKLEFTPNLNAINGNLPPIAPNATQIQISNSIIPSVIGTDIVNQKHINNNQTNNIIPTIVETKEQKIEKNNSVISIGTNIIPNKPE